MQRDRDRLINDAILYACAFAVSAAGVRAVTMTLADPDLARAFMLALVVGFVVSWFLRRYDRLRRYAFGWTALLAVVALLSYERTGTFLGQPVAALVGPDRQLGLGVLLAGLAIVLSFGLVNVNSLLFCVVPSLAIFGVMGSTTFDPQFMLAFLVFIFAATFLAGHEQLMAEREHSRMPPGEDARRAARDRFLVVAILFAFAAGAAVSVARAVAAVVPPYGPEVGIRVTERARERPSAARGGRPVWTSANALPVGTGPVRLGTQVVMRVKCDEPLYWRAGSLTDYTGQAWQAGQERSTTVRRSLGGAFDLRAVVNARPGRTVSQTVEFVNIRANILFAAMQPVQVRLPDRVPRLGPVQLDAAGAVTCDGLLRPNEPYEVESQVDNLRPRGLPSVLSADSLALLAIVFSTREIRDFAKEAVGDIADPEAKVMAIVRWVQARATYSLDAPATPTGEDAVIYFLTQSRVGYCDLFASAVALMCRAAGIPARVAVGYAPGERDRASGVYVVREQDSHAWVEAYLADRGWITVEASPAAGAEAQTVARPSWMTRLSRFISRNLLYALAALAVLAWAAWAAKGRWLDDFLAVRRRERVLMTGGAHGEIILLYDRLGRALARRALLRRESETPNEFLARLGRNAYLATIMPGARHITSAYLAARFSERDISGNQVAVTRQALEDVQARLRKIRAVR